MKLSTLFRRGTTAPMSMNVPRNSNEHPEKDFMVHQHLIILAVKELERKTYRDPRLIGDSNAPDVILNLRMIHLFTTPQSS